MKKPRGGSWCTPGLLTRYAILGNRQFAGSEDTGSAYVLTTGAYTPEFPEVEETMRGGHTAIPWNRYYSRPRAWGG